MAKRSIRHADIVRHFAERLRALRRSRGMTQRDLAGRANVTVSYVSTLEAGAAAPGIDLLERLARALQADVTDLLPSPTGPETPQALRQQVERVFESVLAKAGPDSLSMLRSLLERLAESPATSR
jgi:transcriptional regulator with XRE-family HTH domain